MSSLENNKIFAAVLVAGIVAMLSGFVAELLTEPHEIEKDAVTIEGAAEAGGGDSTAVAMPEPILGMIATADVAQGEKLAKACAACHDLSQGGADKVGPDLWGVVGRKKASHGAFAYSDAMKQHGGSWTYLELNHFLWGPRKFIPGTKMTFIGFKKPQDRADVIAYLRTLGGAALPSPGEIAEEAKELAPPAAPAAVDAKDAAAPAKPGEEKPAAAAPEKK